MKEPSPRRPAAFRLDRVRFAEEAETDQIGRQTKPVLIEEPDVFAEAETVPAALPQRRRFRWTGILVTGVGGLITLALGLAVANLVDTLFQRTGWLGWVGVVLTALAVVALLAILVREVIGLLSLRRIGKILAEATEAAATDSREQARSATRQVLALYENRPETARGRAALAGHLREIIDGRDLIGLAETEVLAPFDDAARRMVMSAARRVSVVTAISPRALVDVLFVLAEIMRLIRRLAALYGGRPGFLGFVRLTRSVVAHLAVTGGMAAGDSIVQQFLGHGIAARISARLGEGVINGILTARVGIAAIEVCRPLPFIAGKPPRMSDVVAELTKRTPKAADAAP